VERPKRGVAVKVSGDFACFSRPELKVERVSYDVMTPSAARGVLEAIFWKPEFRYEVREIHVLKLGTKLSVLRNEMKHRQGRQPVVLDQNKRVQRTSLILKDVEYVIRAELVMRDGREPGGYLDQFNRRMKSGQCHHMPYLGTRECAASFEPPDKGDSGDERNPGLTLHLGNMLLDLAYVEKAGEKNQFRRGLDEDARWVSGIATPVIFDAWIEGGVMKIPREKYAEVYALESGHV
jgi:CRISPR-associated protein Cas5d